MKKFSLTTLFALLCILSNAATIYVDHTVPTNINNDGSTWAKALNKLENALATSSPGDIIRISLGTYTAPSGGYILEDEVRILGGHAPALTNPIPDFLRNITRNPNLYPVNLVGAFHNYVFSATTDISSTTVTDGVIIGDQNSDGLNLTNHTHYFKALFINCKFKTRRYSLHIDEASNNFTPSFINCDFTRLGPIGNNTAAVYIQSTGSGSIGVTFEPSFENCKFYDLDHAVIIIPFFGIHIPKFDHCEFNNILDHVFTNNANVTGGGIGLWYSQLNLPCPSPTEFMYAPTINNSIFYNNGGILDYVAWFTCSTTDIAPKFTNCTLYDNPGFNSAFRIENHSSQVTNTHTIVGLELENCISDNNLSGNILMKLGTGMNVNLKHCIIEASSTLSNGTISDPVFDLLNPHPSIDQVVDLGGNIFNTNPKFVSTALPIPNLDILATSPARNSGYLPLGAPGATATDFIGRARVSESTIDIGAYEYCPTQNGCYPTSPIKSSITPESIKELSVKIYPNPFSDLLHITKATGTKGQITIYNITGKLIFNQEFESNETTIDLSNFSNGIYTITITDANSSITKKLVKN